MIKKIKLEELTIDNMAAWPLPIKLTVVGLINVLLVVVIYQIFLQTQFQQLNALRAGNKNLQQIFSHQQQQLNHRVAYEKQLKILQQNWMSKTQQLSSPNQVADLLADITRIGMSNGLQFKSVRPFSEQVQTVLTVLPVEIQVQGEYPQLTRFLLQLSMLKHSVSLQDFTLAKIEATSQLALTLMLNIYRTDDVLNNSETSVTSLSATQHNPFQSGVNPDGIESVTTFAVDTLHMVGYLQQGIKQWVLLAATNGHVYRVTIGSEVGHHHGTVTKINSEKIEITEQENGQSKILVLQIHK